jgi:FkbM family methyltransferase
MITRNYLTFPFYIPRIIGLLENWSLYLRNYVGRRKKPAEYRLRNGFKLVDTRGTLAGTFAVVFVRREYGYPVNCRTIVDIGANMGSFTVFAAQCCPGARIFSFEPEQGNFNVLQQNVAVNSLADRIQVLNCAVASSSGTRRLALDESPLNSLVPGGEVTDHQNVRCTTLRDILSDYALEKIDFLKMNCEGAEYEILEGCTEAEFSRMPNIRLEYHNLPSIGRRGTDLAKFLQDKGYKIERFTRYRDESGFIWAARS